jgi:AcrR family transcriptional regulator
MTRATRTPALKDAYHHGRLRRALMDEALRRTAAHGIDGWSMREVSAALGVTHAAPYHHFRDRAGLVAAIAREGLDLMDARMAASQAAAGADPLVQLLAIGLAYVTFAVERPDYYAAIAAGPKPGHDGSALDADPAEGGGATWQRLMRAVAACQEAGCLPATDTVIVAVNLWSLVHGLAELWKAGPLQQLPHASRGLVPLAEQVLRAAVVAARPPSATRTRRTR